VAKHIAPERVAIVGVARAGHAIRTTRAERRGPEIGTLHLESAPELAEVVQRDERDEESASLRGLEPEERRHAGEGERPRLEDRVRHGGDVEEMVGGRVPWRGCVLSGLGLSPEGEIY
jgi:hypothetical protein